MSNKGRCFASMERLTVAQLKERCRAAGVPVGGTKVVLIARLSAPQIEKPQPKHPVVIPHFIGSFPLSSLPVELLYREIAPLLSVGDIISLSDVCREMRTIMTNEEFIGDEIAAQRRELIEKYRLIEWSAQLGLLSLYNKTVPQFDYDAYTAANCKLYWLERGLISKVARFKDRYCRYLPLSTKQSWGALRELTVAIKNRSNLLAQSAIPEIIAPFEHNMVYLGRLLLRCFSLDDPMMIVREVKNYSRFRTLVYACLAAYVANEQYDRIVRLMSAIDANKHLAYIKIVCEYISPFGIAEINRLNPSLLAKLPKLERVRNPSLFWQLAASETALSLRYYHLVLSPREAFLLAERLLVKARAIKNHKYEQYVDKYKRRAWKAGHNVWADTVPTK